MDHRRRRAADRRLARHDYAKARVRDAVDFPLAGAAVALKRDGEQLAGLRVAITGTNSAPRVVPTDALLGGPWDAASAQALAKGSCRRRNNVLATSVATVRYRRRMAQALNVPARRRTVGRG